MASSHHTARKILFRTLIVVYVCAAAVIIPYAFGYRFSPERGVFVYAGSITIKTNPRLATVAVDGVPTDTDRNFINDSYHLTGLVPGTHTVTVTADGHQTFEKRLDVSSGYSTEIWNALLPRISYDRTTVATATMDGAFYRSPDGRYAAWTARNDNRLVLTIAAIASGTVRTVDVPAEVAMAMVTADANIEWRPDGRSLLIPLTTADGTDTLIALLDDDGTVTGMITLGAILTPTATDVRQVRWDPRDRNAFYAVIDGDLRRVTLTTATDGTTPTVATAAPVATNVRTYTIAGDMLYYLDAGSGMVFRTATGDARDATHVQVTASHLSGDGDAVMTVYGSDADTRIAVRFLRDGTLYLWDAITGNGSAPLRTLGTGIEGFLFSDDGKKLLYWTRNDIMTYFTRDWDVQPVRRAGDTLTVGHFADRIGQVQWHRDYEHVVYVVGDDLHITELDTRGGRLTRTLATVGAGATVRADHADNRLYLATGTGVDRILSWIAFPEPETGLFR